MAMTEMKPMENENVLKLLKKVETAVHEAMRDFCFGPPVHEIVLFDDERGKAILRDGAFFFKPVKALEMLNIKITITDTGIELG